MCEEMLIKHCSPTLAGLKTGNMFTCYFENEVKMRDSIRSFNRILVKKGLRILPLRFRNNRGLIYVYRPSRLCRDFKNSGACRILEECGYTPSVPASCITRLMKRLNGDEDFPHEIGLFLGYPPEDVCGFMENRAEGCKCVGCWKVYGDADAAEKTFARYKKCTDIYCALFAEGRSIERLTVNVA